MENKTVAGRDMDLISQIRVLEQILKEGPLWEIIHEAGKLGLPGYYTGAGCIAQTVWNYQEGRDPAYGIGDVDLVYFDSADLSAESEQEAERRACAMLSHIPFKLDVKNEARVHLWYEDRFGYGILPYTSTEDAINTWPTTATAVGVRPEGGGLAVYAPFGLNDLFCRVVRANKVQITEDIYRAKYGKWRAKWPSLNVIPW